MAFDVEVVRELSHDLLRPWNELLERSHKPNMQMCFEYVDAWCRNIAEDWKPFIIVVKEKDTVVGILPLMRLEEKRRGFIPYIRLRFLAATSTDFSTPLMPEERQAEFLDAAMNHLFSKEKWQSLVLEDIVEGDVFLGNLKKWLDHKGIGYEIEERRYYYIDLQRTWEEIWLDTGKKFVRKNTNLARNRLEKEGSWSVLVDPDWDVERMINTAMPMHVERQEDLGRVSKFTQEDYRRFLLEVLGHFMDRGMLRSYWLVFGGVHIAYLIGFEQENIFYAWNMAFEPGYDKYFPSKFLMRLTVEDCFERGNAEYNFMRGESDYKSKWTKTTRVNTRFRIANDKRLYGKMIHKLEKLSK